MSNRKKLQLLIRFVYSFIIFITLFSTANAQQLIWEKVFDNEDINNANCVTVDNVGNIIISGNNINQYEYGLTIKYNEFGDTIWTRRSEIPITDISCDSYGNVIVGGEILSNDSIKICIEKYDFNGNKIWNYLSKGYKIFRSSVCLAVDSNDDIIVCGQLDKDNGNDYDILTLKVNSNAELQWASSFNAYWEEYPTAITIDNNDNIIISCSSNKGYDYDWYTIKYNENGDSLWSKSLDMTCWDWPTGNAVDSIGNIYVVGYTDSTTNLDSSSAKIICKYSSSGELIWKKLYYMGNNYPYVFWSGIALNTTGDLFISGYYKTKDTQGLNWCDFYLEKYDYLGNSNWRFISRIDDNMVNEANDVVVNNNSTIITGYTKEFSDSGAEKYCTIKINNSETAIYSNSDASNNVDWKTYPNPFNNNLTISFSLVKQEYIDLSIYNLIGERITTLLSKECESGDLLIKWDVESLPSGIYIVQLKTEDDCFSKKIILNK